MNIMKNVAWWPILNFCTFISYYFLYYIANFKHISSHLFIVKLTNDPQKSPKYQMTKNTKYHIFHMECVATSYTWLKQSKFLGGLPLMTLAIYFYFLVTREFFFLLLSYSKATRFCVWHFWTCSNGDICLVQF